MIFVHIGVAKAGSSMLQYFLHANTDRLSEQGVAYAEPGLQGVAHHQLSRSLTRPNGVNSAVWQELRAWLAAKPESHVVISSEGFEGIDPGQLRLALAGHPVKIVCYTRETVVRLPSSYTQNSKFGLNLADFDAFFDQQQTPPQKRWLYGAFLRGWADAFGAENVRARSLDPSALVGGDLVSDFLSVLGVTPDTFRPPVSHPDRVNESPGWKLVEALRSLHAAGVGSNLAPAAKMEDQVLWRYLRRAFVLGRLSAEAMGWSDRGKYLARWQNEQLTETYSQQLDLVNSLGIDAVLVRAAYDPKLNREFLPSVERIPTEELSAVLLDLTPKLTRTLLAWSRPPG